MVKYHILFNVTLLNKNTFQSHRLSSEIISLGYSSAACVNHRGFLPKSK